MKPSRTSSDTKRSNDVLDGVVVDVIPAIVAVSDELLPMVVEIGKRLAELTFGDDLGS